jgi:UDP-glucose 4-epimerase
VFVGRFSNGFGAPVSRSADCWTLAFPSFCQSVVETGHIVLKSAGMQQRDFLPLYDMCSAIELLLGAPALAPGDTDIAYNVGGKRSMSMRDAAWLVAAEYEALTGAAAHLVLPEGNGDPSPEPPVDYRFDRMAPLGYWPQADPADEVRSTLQLLGAGAAR